MPWRLPDPYAALRKLTSITPISFLSAVTSQLPMHLMIGPSAARLPSGAANTIKINFWRQDMQEKPVFNSVLQVAIVVKDCDATVKKYADDYGMGPWSIYEFNPNTVSDMIIDGKKVDYAMRLALADIGGVQWEIIQPKDDTSIYAHFLKEHGEGLHHVAFGTDNYEKTVQFYKDKGRPILQGGTWKGLTYTYLDSREDLKVIAEIYNLVPDFAWPAPESVYPVK
jgi:hypothetical protein